MKPNLRRGVTSKIMWGLLALICAGFFYYVQLDSSAASLASKGYIYPESRLSTDTTTFQVKALTKVEGLRDGESQAYVASNDQYNILIMAKPDMEIIKSLEDAQTAGTLTSQPQTILGKVENPEGFERSDAIKFFLEEGPEAYRQQKLENFRLNLTKAYGTADTSNMVVAALAFVAVVCLVLALIRYGQNRRFYEGLLVDFPELAQDNQALRRGAVYYEKQLGVYLYKDQLIVMGAKNQRVDLRDILYTYVVKQTTWVNFYRKVSFFLKLHTRDFKTISAHPLSAGTKKTQEKLDQLMRYLDEHYPEMLVGTEHAAEYQGLRQAARR